MRRRLERHINLKKEYKLAKENKKYLKMLYYKIAIKIHKILW